MPATSFGRGRRGIADADLGGGAVLGLIPFGRDRDQFAVAVARRDVGDHDMGQGPGMVQLLAALLDAALVAQARAASS